MNSDVLIPFDTRADLNIRSDDGGIPHQGVLIPFDTRADLNLKRESTAPALAVLIPFDTRADLNCWNARGKVIISLNPF